MKVEFDTTEYEFSHGKMPRGYGSWAFAFERNAKIDDVFWGQGTYAEAKKHARAVASEKRQCVVYVMP